MPENQGVARLMDLSIEEIGELLGFIQNLDYAVVEVTVGDVHLAVRRNGAGAASVDPPALPAQRTPPRAATGGTSAPPEAVAAPATAPAPRATDESAGVLEAWLAREADGSVTIIRAPMVGTFYRAKEPGAPPFVEIGQTAQPGDIVCLVEVMKLFHSVSTEVGGVVEDIFVEDGGLVEFRQPLLVISRT